MKEIYYFDKIIIYIFLHKIYIKFKAHTKKK